MSTLLVEVVRIDEINKHDNADTLSVTQVKGWNCIIKTGEFQTGDLAVYVPIDAVIPDRWVEHYQLEYLRNGARVRTVKLRGVLSQGLLLTIPEGYAFREGQDVAGAMGITKWEPPAPAYQTQGAPNHKATRNRPNPNFTRYCDPENVKQYPTVFHSGDLVCITEKIHGTNFRAGWVSRHWGNGWWARVKKGLLGWWLTDWEWCVGSRNVHLVGDNPQFYDGNIYHQIAERYGLKEKCPKGYTLYGEIYGDKIQDLTYGLSNGKIDVMFYDMKKGDQYLDWPQFIAYCQVYGVPHVPVLWEGPYDPAALSVNTCGPTRVSGAGSQLREGCVVKTLVEENDRHIGRKILKSINPDYLLRKDGTEYH